MWSSSNSGTEEGCSTAKQHATWRCDFVFRLDETRLDWVLHLQTITFLFLFFSFLNNTQPSDCKKWGSVWRSNTHFTTSEQHFIAIVGEILPYYFQTSLTSSIFWHFPFVFDCLHFAGPVFPPQKSWINASDLFLFSPSDSSNRLITPQFLHCLQGLLSPGTILKCKCISLQPCGAHAHTGCHVEPWWACDEQRRLKRM